jgi:hypothetical protein
MYFDICKDLNQPAKLIIEVSGNRGASEQIDVENYIKNFKWDQVRFQMDKSLKVLGAKIQATQKTCDDRLKKIMDEQAEVKTKLSHLITKDSPSFLQKDLADVVYEKKITKQMFVNTYGSDIMTTILVVVNKKKLESFRSSYMNVLLDYYQNDFEGW